MTTKGKIAIFSSHSFEKPYLLDANKGGLELIFINDPLTIDTAPLCKGCDGIGVFTSDDVSAPVLDQLKALSITFVVTRSTGHDHIDIQTAAMHNIKLANVPGYSPHAIAEHAVALMLSLDRRLILSSHDVKLFDFRIDELIGFNLHNKIVGVIGTGKIGSVICKILNGFGCRILAYDILENEELVKSYGVKYVTLKTLCNDSDIVTLHAPLNENTTYMINKEAISWMKKGVMLINTSRGKLMNSLDVLEALNSGKIGYLGTDVYEHEKGFFFVDHSKTGITDNLLRSLISHKNVLVTAHHAFLTKEALKNIADITIANIECFLNNKPNPNLLT